MALADYQSNRPLVLVLGFKTSLFQSSRHHCINLQDITAEFWRYLQVERWISWLKKYLFSWTWEGVEVREQKHNLGNKSSILSDGNWQKISLQIFLNE